MENKQKYPAIESEIKEAFDYLASNPGGLTIGQCDLIKGFQKYYKEHGELSERQQRSLFEIKKYRESRDKHLY